MASPKKNEHFWDILKDLVRRVPYKKIADTYGIPITTLANYRNRYIVERLELKDDIVDDNQLKFGFMRNHFWRSSDKYINPNRESSFYTRWKERRREE